MLKKTFLIGHDAVLFVNLTRVFWVRITFSGTLIVLEQKYKSCQSYILIKHMESGDQARSITVCS